MSYYRKNYRKKSYGNSYGNKGGKCRTCGRYQKNLAAHLRAYPSHKKVTRSRSRRRYY